MRGRPSIWTRTQRLAATAGDPLGDPDGDQVVLRLAEATAAERGVPVEVLLAEAEVAVAHWGAAGAVTREAVVARVAAEHGVDPDEVWAELAAMGVGPRP
ncbi:MAG: hypothetical protein M3R02_10825 [Chloroflexota bacterium]|nr:hypothetical protein [Chloroflexota bacterium]